MTEECEICCSDFPLDDKVTCPCGKSSCSSCVKEYIGGSNKLPNCMFCSRGWERSTQYSLLGAKYINGPYKNKRKDLLMQMETARLPETQNLVTEELLRRKRKKILLDINKRLKIVREDIGKTKLKMTMLPLIGDEWTRWNDQLIQFSDKQNDLINERNQFYYGSATYKKVPEKKFIQKCRNGDCRGFLSTAWKCDICETFSCSKCFDVKGPKTNSKHTCKKENIESAEMIKKETRNCPTCAIPIFKISGCHQMFCVECHTAFDWVTGRVHKGAIHNPHYFEAANAGVLNVVRNPADQVCGGMPDIGEFLLLNQLAGSNGSKMEHIYRGYNHIFDIIVRPLRTAVTGDVNNSHDRVLYMLQEIDEKRLRRNICMRDNVREKNQAMLHVMELFTTIMVDNVGLFMSKDDNHGPAILDNARCCIAAIENARVYCNQQMKKIHKDYNMKVFYIPSEYPHMDKRMVTFSDPEELAGRETYESYRIDMDPEFVEEIQLKRDTEGWLFNEYQSMRTDEVYYILSKSWYKKWSDFLEEKTNRLPGKISNTDLYAVGFVQDEYVKYEGNVPYHHNLRKYGRIYKFSEYKKVCGIPVSTPDETINRWYSLKRGLCRNMDYVTLTKNSWDFLVETYGIDWDGSIMKRDTSLIYELI